MKRLKDIVHLNVLFTLVIMQNFNILSVINKMKISLAISLLVHLVIFAFLNIYKYEKSSDELISSVSVISQNYYDALISKKPDINHDLIPKTTRYYKIRRRIRF